MALVYEDDEEELEFQGVILAPEQIERLGFPVSGGIRQRTGGRTQGAAVGEEVVRELRQFGLQYQVSLAGLQNLFNNVAGRVASSVAGARQTILGVARQVQQSPLGRAVSGAGQAVAGVGAQAWKGITAAASNTWKALQKAWGDFLQQMGKWQSSFGNATAALRRAAGLLTQTKAKYNRLVSQQVARQAAMLPPIPSFQGQPSQVAQLQRLRSQLLQQRNAVIGRAKATIGPRIGKIESDLRQQGAKLSNEAKKVGSAQVEAQRTVQAVGSQIQQQVKRGAQGAVRVERNQIEVLRARRPPAIPPAGILPRPRIGVTVPRPGGPPIGRSVGLRPCPPGFIRVGNRCVPPPPRFTPRPGRPSISPRRFAYASLTFEDQKTIAHYSMAFGVKCEFDRRKGYVFNITSGGSYGSRTHSYVIPIVVIVAAIAIASAVATFAVTQLINQLNSVNDALAQHEADLAALDARIQDVDGKIAVLSSQLTRERQIRRTQVQRLKERIPAPTPVEGVLPPEEVEEVPTGIEELPPTEEFTPEEEFLPEGVTAEEGPSILEEELIEVPSGEEEFLPEETEEEVISEEELSEEEEL